MSAKRKHIAVIRFSAMGDVAMTVPVIRALVNQYPDIDVTVVSRPFFSPFFKDIPNVRFFAIDVKKRHKGIKGIWRLYRELKELEIDAVADFHNVIRSKILRIFFSLDRIPVACTDKGRAEKRTLTRKKNKVFKPLKSMTQRHVETLKKLGYTITLLNPVFPAKKVLTGEVLKMSGVKESYWVGIAPFAQYETKSYPLDLMEDVICRLDKNEKVKIFLFGGGEEEIRKLNHLKGDREKVIVVAGKISMEEELRLISHLDAMLSMDSGNAHIAAMMGIPVVTLWGATHPYAGFMPFHQPDTYALTADRQKYPLLPTSVYGNKQIPGYESVMRTIEPEKVVQTLNRVLFKNP